jgi:hypothetical protein
MKNGPAVRLATRGQVCVAESLRLAALRMSPPQARKVWGLGRTSSSEVVGPAYDMMSSHLTGVQGEMKQNDFEVAIPIAQAPAALAEFKQYASKHNVCLPLVGVFLRFGVADPGTLAVHSAAGKGFAPGSGLMFFEFVVYRPKGHTVSAADDYFGPYWWWAEHLIKRYGGRPHWAKNEIGIFQYALRENPDQAERLSAFRGVMDRFDPHHRFANAFTDETGLSAGIKR